MKAQIYLLLLHFALLNLISVARPSTSKKITTCFIVIFALWQWSRTETAMSPRCALVFLKDGCARWFKWSEECKRRERGRCFFELAFLIALRVKSGWLPQLEKHARCWSLTRSPLSWHIHFLLLYNKLPQH